jgi:hypothetical protein
MLLESERTEGAFESHHQKLRAVSSLQLQDFFDSKAGWEVAANPLPLALIKILLTLSVLVRKCPSF